MNTGYEKFYVALLGVFAAIGGFVGPLSAGGFSSDERWAIACAMPGLIGGALGVRQVTNAVKNTDRRERVAHFRDSGQVTFTSILAAVGLLFLIWLVLSWLSRY